MAVQRRNSILDQLLADQPKFHRRHTEISRQFQADETFPIGAETAALSSERQCYGIVTEFAQWLFTTLVPWSRSLETGAGISTLVFALAGTTHTAITPDAQEVSGIRAYAAKMGIALDSIEFVNDASDRYLPHCDRAPLDYVLLDGKHAFPWPMIDWFYTADRLVTGGLLMLDDIHLRSVGILVDFLSNDPHWRLELKPGGRTAVFRKTRPNALDVTWGMQPWNKPTLTLRQRVGSLKRKIQAMTQWQKRPNEPN